MHKLSVKLAALALAASSIGLTQTASAGDRVTVIYSSGSYYAAPHAHRHYYGHRGDDHRHHRYERRYFSHRHGHDSHYRKSHGHGHRHADRHDRKRGHENYGRYRDTDRHGGHRSDSHRSDSHRSDSHRSDSHRSDSHRSFERRDRNDHRVKHTAHVSRHVF